MRPSRAIGAFLLVAGLGAIGYATEQQRCIGGDLTAVRMSIWLDGRIDRDSAARASLIPSSWLYAGGVLGAATGAGLLASQFASRRGGE